ncbi:hypothetical protein DPMN_148986 [Dreissena polymorpha]|uniref:EGF-like domain-containing protein n=1 Tax=Dreissena polymorpha TaxID=45954 RepID=A0A9D4FCT3_DREPO|nr:hypothetical protein DPMN_148986 [Dreissena polymorpha]
MCAWNIHFCWPGFCTGGLTENCVCANGFIKRSTIDDSSLNAGETTCQPNTQPKILMCDTVAMGPNGEKKRAININASNACEHMIDMFGNFKPVRMVFIMESEFLVKSSLFPPRPNFILEENFGITDTTINAKAKSTTGLYTDVSFHKLLVDTSSSAMVTQIRLEAGNISVIDTKYNLQNGQA